MKEQQLELLRKVANGELTPEKAQTELFNLFSVMPLLPYQIESVNVVNTGLNDCEVEGIEWIDNKRIGITNSAECVYDDGYGGTCVALTNEFEWSFVERDVYSDAYVLIELRQ